MFKKFKIFKWLLFSLFNSQFVLCFNYCSSSVCNNTRQHTLCQYPVATPGERCIEHERIILTPEVKIALLDKINSRRNKIASGDVRSFPSAQGMIKLEWNEELEKSSQRWADQCTAQDDTADVKDTCRDLENVSVGQNIATVYGESPGMSPLSLVDVWYTELLNTNASIVLRYTPSSRASHYNYFTQLVWALSTEVGCGGVKFKERLNGSSAGRNRTVNRLVCNFATSGNIVDEAVYTTGPPCSRCPYASTCDTKYKALCKQNRKKINTDNVNEDNGENSNTEKNKKIFINHVNVTEDENFNFDYLSNIFDYSKQAFTTTPPPIVCKDVLAVDEFVELLKKKLSNDPIFKELLLSTKSVQIDYAVTDPNVAMFVSKIYSKKEMTTTTKMPESDYVNSTLLVDLVEAVIFRSGERTVSTDKIDDFQQSLMDVSPVKIQAELAEVKQNHDFTGHYFFPEDSTEESNTETINAYDDSASISVSDVVLEIEDLKRDRTTKDFLEDIIESDIMSESAVVSRKKRNENIPCNKNNHMESCMYKIDEPNIFRTKYSSCTDFNKSLNWIRYCKLLEQLALDLEVLKLNERFSCSNNCNTRLLQNQHFLSIYFSIYSLLFYIKFNLLTIDCN